MIERAVITMMNLRRNIIGKFRLFQLKMHAPQFTVGKGFFCGHGCFVSRKNKIHIGSNFYMGNYCHLAANVVIGDDVLFASFVSLVGGDHKVDGIDTLIRLSGRDVLKPTVIENNVWVGHGAILLHGIRIGSGAVIGAGAVVTKDVPANAIYGGNPARLIRFRK